MHPSRKMLWFDFHTMQMQCKKKHQVVKLHIAQSLVPWESWALKGCLMVWIVKAVVCLLLVLIYDILFFQERENQNLISKIASLQEEVLHADATAIIIHMRSRWLVTREVTVFSELTWKEASSWSHSPLLTCSAELQGHHGDGRASEENHRAVWP